MRRLKIHRELKSLLAAFSLVVAFFIFIVVGRSSAKEVTFDEIYALDLPVGWSFTQEEAGYTVFISPDQKAVFLITTGLSLVKHREKTEELVKKYDELRQGSPDRFATLMKVRNKRVAVTIIGDHPDRVKMFRSIEGVTGDKMRDEWREE